MNRKLTRRQVLTAAAAGAALTLCGCRQQEPEEAKPELILRYAENQPEDYPTTQAALAFAGLMADQTDGRVKVAVYSGGELGAEQSVIQQMQFGGIDFARVSLSQLAEYIPALSVLQLPYLYEDASQMWRVLDGSIGDDFLAMLDQMDLVGLSWFDAGVRSFYTREKVTDLEQLQGLTLRVQESDMMSEMITDLGAEPVQVVYSQVYAALRNGQIDGAENNWPSYGCNKSKLLSIPFTFENRAHFWNFANSDLAPEFLNEPQELGLPVRGIFYGEEGFRHFFTVNPVSGIEDFKGLKLRVSNDPVMNGMVEGLGANPTVVSFGELYSALQTGVVDGAEQPIANYKSNAFPEVANNLILDGHTLGAIQAVITDNAWGKLTENQQAAIMEAGADTQAFNADLSESAENKVLDELKSSGCNVVDVPDKTPWQEACQKVISENTSDQAELYQQLLDMKG